MYEEKHNTYIKSVKSKNKMNIHLIFIPLFSYSFSLKNEAITVNFIFQQTNLCKEGWKKNI